MPKNQENKENTINWGFKYTLSDLNMPSKCPNKELVVEIEGH